MFTGTPEELKRAEAAVRLAAKQIASLLNNLDAIGLGFAAGQLHTPGGIIRRTGSGWTVSDR